MLRVFLLMALSAVAAISATRFSFAQAYQTDRPQDAAAVQLANQGRYQEAEALLRRTLQEDREKLGPTHPNTIDTTENLANVLDLLGRRAEGEPLHRFVLATREEKLGVTAPATLRALRNLGINLQNQNKIGEAISVLERGASASAAAFGARAPEALSALNELGVAYLKAGSSEDAEHVLSRAVTQGRAVLGDDHPNVLTWSINLANSWFEQARFQDANALYEAVIDRLDRTQGPVAPMLLSAKNNHAFNLMTQGRILDAIPIFRDLLEVREQTLGPLHQHTMTARLMLGNALSQTAQADDLLALRSRDLNLLIDAIGSEHPSSLRSMRKYADALHAVGRRGEAQEVREYVLSLSRKVLGNRHEETLMAMNSLATGLNAAGKHGPARKLMHEAHEGFVSLVGPEHPWAVDGAINLASMVGDDGDPAAAIALLRQLDSDLVSNPRVTPHQRIRVAFSLATMLHDTGAPAEAARVLAAKVTEADAVYGKASTLPDEIRVQLAGSLLASRASREALELARVAHAGLGERLRQSGDLTPGEQRVAHEAAARAAWTLISAAWSVSENATRDEAESLAAEAFEAAQTIGLGPSAFAISRASGRIAAEQGGAARRFDAWNDARRDLAAYEARVAQAVAGGAVGLDADTYQRLQSRAEQTRQELQGAFPDFFDLINPAAVAAEDFMAGGGVELAADEALILFAPQSTTDRSVISGQGFVWAVTREGIAWARLALPARELEAQVIGLRRAISPDEALVLASRAPLTPSVASETGTISRFDAATAHDLYTALFGRPEIAATIGSKRKWLIAPQGPLLSLPFGALVTTPQQRFTTEAETLRKTAWLGRDRALSVLPALQLVTQGRGNGTGPRRQGYVGFGDPDFVGASVPLRTATAGLRDPSRDLRGSLRTLPRLPGTRAEVLTLAERFGADEESVFLGAEASEEVLRALDRSGRLAQTRILHFATHGLISGDLAALAEPALAMSPSGTGMADGVLTASEAATLKLDADWVLLSACNTAAGERPGAEGLSGLARAFFFAGARNMLVTHWPVRDDLTSDLIVRVVDPEADMTQSEAMRVAIAALVEDESEDHRVIPLAHPRNWAGFLVIGAGAGDRS